MDARDRVRVSARALKHTGRYGTVEGPGERGMLRVLLDGDGAATQWWPDELMPVRELAEGVRA